MSRRQWAIAIAATMLGATPAWAGSFEPYWHFSGVFHPAVAHFPIALLMVAGVLEVFRLRTRGRVPGDAAYICLCLGAVAAVVASGLGWANADASGGFNGALKEVVLLHRWMGVSVAALAVLVLVAATVSRRRERPRAALVWGCRAGVLANAALVALVGSFGGKLTHGVNYYADAYDDLQAELKAEQEPAQPTVAATPVAEPRAAEQSKPADETTSKAAPADVKKPDPPAAVSPAETATQQEVKPAATPPSPGSAQAPDPAPAVAKIDFATQIRPIFSSHCVTCHNEKKHKGSYRLDSPDFAFKPGGSDEMPIVPGDAEKSRLIKAVEGKGDFEDEMMPPKGTLLTPQEITLLRKWIDDGATWPASMTVPEKGG
jgi:uncharacterized membrane protein